MKGVLVGLLSVLLISACHRGVETPEDKPDFSLSTPSGEVIVKELQRDVPSRTINALVVAGKNERHVSIMPLDERSLPVGIKADVTNESGVLFEVSVAWDPNDPDHAWFREQTGSDVLTASRHREGDRIIEEYNLNGYTFSIDYPALPADVVERAIVHSENGWKPEDPEIAELIEKFGEFKVFYSRHIGNTLINNADGDLLISLITNEQFAAQATKGNDSDPSPAGGKTLSRVCAVASLCSFLKCHLGGLLNPVCDACTGTAIACAIAIIGCWIFGCE